MQETITIEYNNFKFSQTKVEFKSKGILKVMLSPQSKVEQAVISLSKPDQFESLTEMELKKFYPISIEMIKRGTYLLKDVWSNSSAELEVLVSSDSEEGTLSTADTTRPVSLENSIERYIQKFEDIKQNQERCRSLNFNQSDSDDESDFPGDVVRIEQNSSFQCQLNASCHLIQADTPVKFLLKFNDAHPENLLLSASSADGEILFSNIELSQFKSHQVFTFYKTGKVKVYCSQTMFQTEIEIQPKQNLSYISNTQFNKYHDEESSSSTNPKQKYNNQTAVIENNVNRKLTSTINSGSKKSSTEPEMKEMQVDSGFGNAPRVYSVAQSTKSRVQPEDYLAGKHYSLMERQTLNLNDIPHEAISEVTNTHLESINRKSPEKPKVIKEESFKLPSSSVDANISSFNVTLNKEKDEEIKKKKKNKKKRNKKKKQEEYFMEEKVDNSEPEKVEDEETHVHVMSQGMSFGNFTSIHKMDPLEQYSQLDEKCRQETQEIIMQNTNINNQNEINNLYMSQSEEEIHQKCAKHSLEYKIINKTELESNEPIASLNPINPAITEDHLNLHFLKIVNSESSEEILNNETEFYKVLTNTAIEVIHEVDFDTASKLEQVKDQNGVKESKTVQIMDLEYKSAQIPQKKIQDDHLINNDDNKQEFEILSEWDSNQSVKSFGSQKNQNNSKTIINQNHNKKFVSDENIIQDKNNITTEFLDKELMNKIKESHMDKKKTKRKKKNSVAKETPLPVLNEDVERIDWGNHDRIYNEMNSLRLPATKVKNEQFIIDNLPESIVHNTSIYISKRSINIVTEIQGSLKFNWPQKDTITEPN